MKGQQNKCPWSAEAEKSISSSRPTPSTINQCTPLPKGHSSTNTLDRLNLLQSHPWLPVACITKRRLRRKYPPGLNPTLVNIILHISSSVYSPLLELSHVLAQHVLPAKMAPSVCYFPAWPGPSHNSCSLPQLPPFIYISLLSICPHSSLVIQHMLPLLS